MFNLFKKIFLKQNKPIENRNFMCSINFELNHDGTINIVCYWPNFNETNTDKILPVSSEFAILLHSINKGLLKKDIVSTLTSLIDKSNNFDDIFVHNCLSQWLDYVEPPGAAIPNDPLIKPSSVFKQYNIR